MLRVKPSPSPPTPQLQRVTREAATNRKVERLKTLDGNSIVMNPVRMTPKHRATRFLLLCLLVSPLFSAGLQAEAPNPWLVGAAEIDITPTFPIRLRGYSGRHYESEGVSHRLSAKALAIGGNENPGPAVLITFENCVVPDALVQDLAQRLEKKRGIRRERLTVAATHTHNGPLLSNMSETLYIHPLPPDQAKRIDHYTRALVDRLEKVATEALDQRRPATLSWAVAKASFARNRRTPGGPVDHDLPLLVARGEDEEVLAVFSSYACHCTTLTHNRISGDWAGYAMESIQTSIPGSIALIAIGCGGDQNPVRARSSTPEEQETMAREHGHEIGTVVKRLVGNSDEQDNQKLHPLTEPIETQMTWIDLPLTKIPSRMEWQRRAETSDQAGTPGYHARVQLARLDRGESLATHVRYPIQTWAFGDSLAIVFLGGEVVVDYSLRLKRELDHQRVWITAYSNDVACYIPSERVLQEGGYEGGGAMTFHDWPAPFAPGLEKKIIDQVIRLIGAPFARQ